VLAYQPIKAFTHCDETISAVSLTPCGKAQVVLSAVSQLNNKQLNHVKMTKLNSAKYSDNFQKVESYQMFGLIHFGF
jgi:hypothetical protein